VAVKGPSLRRISYYYYYYGESDSFLDRLITKSSVRLQRCVVP